MENARPLPSVFRILKLFFTPLAIGSLIYFGWQSRDQLALVFDNTKPTLLCIAILAWTLMHLIAPAFAAVVFGARGHTLSYKNAANIHAANLPARYLPGGVWHTVGRLVGYRSHGIGQKDLTVFVFLENTLAIAVAGLIGSLLLVASRGLQNWGAIAVVAATACFLLLIATIWILRLPVLDGNANVDTAGFAKSVALVALSWCIAAASFVAFYFSFPDAAASSATIIDVAGSYLVSWAVGFIAIFAPQGIGVFELTAAELLHGDKPIAGIAVLLAGFRLIILAADTIVWVVSRLLFGNDAR